MGGRTAYSLGRARYAIASVPLVVLVPLGLWFYFHGTATGTSEASEAEVHTICSACHAYPQPEIYPKKLWPVQVQDAYRFHEAADPAFKASFPLPPMERVINYYQNRAPEELPLLPRQRELADCPVDFRRKSYQGTGTALVPPAVSNVNLVHLSDPKKLDLLVCDMRLREVQLLKPYEPNARFRTLASVPFPGHAEVVDLDKDGIKDILVADLGSFSPTNDKVGRVIWLKGLPDGTFKPITLLEGVGRVADVQAADFKGEGKLDLVVAAFGWRETGEIIYLENRTTDWSRPNFVPRVLDSRHGAIHVPVGDLNGDGRPDFVALISQEHETVVAFLNEGGGSFRKETLYSAPSPAYGSSGIQLVDLDGDGDLDVLYTNGDMFDFPMLKPYQSVQWLENRGTFPFTHHHLTSLYGAYRAVAAPVTGSGRMDVVAVSCLPRDKFPMRDSMELDSIILLEQTEPGKFVRHSLESFNCDHVTCAVGDIEGKGKVDIVVGDFFFSDYPSNTGVFPVTVLRNQGVRHGRAGK